MVTNAMAKKQRVPLSELAKGRGSNRGNLDDLKQKVQDEKEPTIRLNANVPTPLYNSFRAKAAFNGLSLTKALVQILQRIDAGDIDINPDE